MPKRKLQSANVSLEWPDSMRCLAARVVGKNDCRFPLLSCFPLVVTCGVRLLGKLIHTDFSTYFRSNAKRN